MQELSTPELPPSNLSVIDLMVDRVERILGKIKNIDLPLVVAHSLEPIILTQAKKKLSLESGGKEVENEQFTPLVDLIKSAVADCEQRGIKVRWHTTGNRARFRVLMGALFTKVKEEDKQSYRDQGMLEDQFKEILGQPLLLILLKQIKAGQNIQRLLLLFSSKIDKSFFEVVAQAVEVDNFPARYKKGHQKFNSLKACKLHLEQQYAANPKPVSVSEIISYFLLEHDGDLNLALEDTAFFVKWFARNPRIKEEEDQINDAITFSTLVADQFSVYTSFNSLSPDTQTTHAAVNALSFVPFGKGNANQNINYDWSLVNQIGKPYHVMHMVSLLSHMPPGLISILTGMEYYLYGRLHGLNKASTDISAINQLPELDRYLHSIQ